MRFDLRRAEVRVPAIDGGHGDLRALLGAFAHLLRDCLHDVHVLTHVRDELGDGVDVVDGVVDVADPAHVRDEVPDRRVIRDHGAIGIGHEVEMPRRPHRPAVRGGIRSIGDLGLLGHLLPGVVHHDQRGAGNEHTEQSHGCNLAALTLGRSH